MIYIADYAGIITAMVNTIDKMPAAGAGLPALKKRLLALADQAPAASLARRRRAALDREVRIWAVAITEHLHPELRSKVAKRLLDSEGPHDAHAWRALDEGYADQAGAASKAEYTKVAATIPKFLRSYADTGKVGYMRDAVVAIESAFEEDRSRLASGLLPQQAKGESACLQEALSALPGRPRGFFAEQVRARIADGIDAGALGKDGEQWLSDARWESIGWSWATGSIFQGGMQVAYEESKALAEAGQATAKAVPRPAEVTTSKAIAMENVESAAPDEAQIAREEAIAAEAAQLRAQIDPARLAEPDRLYSFSIEELRGIVKRLAWDARHDAELERRAADRELYEQQLRRG